MKTTITALGLIFATALLIWKGLIEMSVGWGIIAYMIIQLPKRDTQRKIEDASRNPKVSVEHIADPRALK